MKYKLSKSDWERIGEEQGWMKEAVAGAPLSERSIPKLVRLQRDMQELDRLISSIANLSATTADEILNEKIKIAREALFEVDRLITPQRMQFKEIG
jgi:hypothetical protein